MCQIKFFNKSTKNVEGLLGHLFAKCRVGNSVIGFSSNLLVFCEQKSYSLVKKSDSLVKKSDSLVKKSDSLLSLFCFEQPEQIAHSPSFVMSDLSESFTVALF